MAKKKRKGSKLSGRYVGLRNGVSAKDKAKAKRIASTRGLTAAVKFLRKARKSRKR